MVTWWWMGMMGCSAEGVMPMQGPGVDEQGLPTEDRATVVLGLTQLQVKNAPGPGGRFGELVDGIIEVLFPDDLDEVGWVNPPEGWLGAGFRNEGRLHQWTMSMWEDEEAMNAFIMSGPHLQAMLEIGDVAVAATSLHMEVPVEDLPLSWDEALDLLAQQPAYDLGER